MKGVVLAGGTGSRLLPLTKVTNKHLLPVYDRPMIYYPLQCLAAAGIEQVLVVTGGNNSGDLMRLLGSGSEFGFANLNYAYQENAGGIAHALGQAEHFADGDPVCLLLGDNIVEYSIRQSMEQFAASPRGARIFLGKVENLRSHAVAVMNGNMVARLVEKPENPASDWGVAGVYFYDSKVFEIVRSLKPSARNELEITDVNNIYIDRREMSVEKLPGWWTDAGESIECYLKACNRIAAGGANKELPAAK